MGNYTQKTSITRQEYDALKRLATAARQHWDAIQQIEAEARQITGEGEDVGGFVSDAMQEGPDRLDAALRNSGITVEGGTP